MRVPDHTYSMNCSCVGYCHQLPHFFLFLEGCCGGRKWRWQKWKQICCSSSSIWGPLIKGKKTKRQMKKMFWVVICFEVIFLKYLYEINLATASS